MPPKALDIVETQVVVGATAQPDEHGNDWYHLVLIQRLSEQGKWFACNGDLEVEDNRHERNGRKRQSHAGYAFYNAAAKESDTYC